MAILKDSHDPIQIYFLKMNRTGDRNKLNVHEYEFTLHVTKGQVLLRFPCTFFLSWKAGKHLTQDLQSVSPIGSIIPFNSKLELVCQVPYNAQSQSYLETRSSVFVYLNSMTRSSEPKLVGLVTVDLSRCLDDNTYDVSKAYQLERCPDRTSNLTFSLKSRFIRELGNQEIRDLSFSFQQQEQDTGSPLAFNQRGYGQSSVTYNHQNVSATSNERPLTGRQNILPSEYKPQNEQKHDDLLSVQPKQFGLSRSNARSREKDSLNSSNLNNHKNMLSPAQSSLTRNSGHGRSNTKDPKHQRARKQREIWMAKMETTVINRRNEIRDSEFQEQINKYKAKCQILTTEVQSEKGFRRNLEMQLQNARVECSNYKALNKDFERKLMQLRTMQEDLKAMRNMKESLDVAQRKATNQTQKVEDLMRKLQQLRMQNSKLNLVNAELQVSKYMDISKINSNTKNLSQSRKQQKHRSTSTVLAGEDIQDLKAKLEESEFVYQKVKDSMLNNEDKLRKVEQELRLKSQSLVANENKFDEQVKKFELLEKSKEQLNSRMEELKKTHGLEIESKQQSIQQLKSQISRLKTALEQNNSIFQAKRESMTKELLIKQEQNKKISQQFRSTNQALLQKLAQFEQKSKQPSPVAYVQSLLSPILQQIDSQTIQSPPTIPESTIFALNTQIHELRRQIDFLKQKQLFQNQDFLKILEQQKRQRQNLQIQLARIAEEKEHLSNSLKDLQKDQSSIVKLGDVLSRQQIIELKRLESQLSYNAKASQQKLKEAEIQLANKVSTLEQLAALNKQLRSMLQKKQMQFDGLLKEKLHLQTKLKQNEQIIFTLQQQRSELPAMSQKQDTLAKLTEKNAYLEQYLPILQQQVGSLQEQLTQIQAKLASTVKQLEQKIVKLNEVSGQNEQFALNDQLLRESLLDMEATSNELYQQMKQRDQSEGMLEDTIRILELKIKKLSQTGSINKEVVAQNDNIKIAVQKKDYGCCAYIEVHSEEQSAACENCINFHLIQQYLEEKLQKTQRRLAALEQLQITNTVTKSKIAVKMMSAALKTQTKQIDWTAKRLAEAEKQIQRLKTLLEEVSKNNDEAKIKAKESDQALIVSFLQQKVVKLQSLNESLKQEIFKKNSQVCSSDRANHILTEKLDKQQACKHLIEKMSVHMINMTMEHRSQSKKSPLQKSSKGELVELNQQLIQKIGHMEKLLLEHKNSEANYAHQLSELIKVIELKEADTKKEIEDLNEEICRQFSDHNSKDMKIDELTERNAYLEECLKSFENQFETTKAMIKNSQEKIQKQENNAKIDQLLEENTTLKRQNEVYIRLIQNSNDSVAASPAQTLELRRQVEELSHECSNLQKINQTLQQRVLASRITQSPISRPVVADFQHGGIIWQSQMGDVQQTLIIYTTRNRLLAQRLRIVTADRLKLQEKARELIIQVGRIKAKWLMDVEGIDKKREVLENVRGLQQVSETLVNVLEGVDQAIMTQQSSQMDLRDVDEELGRQESEG